MELEKLIPHISRAGNRQPIPASKTSGAKSSPEAGTDEHYSDDAFGDYDDDDEFADYDDGESQSA